jgi:hypothetical protein
MDNAASENKNRWLVAFLCWLIHKGWFFEVMVSFLPPGHTHVDIDQMFSTLAIWLKTHSVYFVSDLVNKLPSAYTTSITQPVGAFLSKVTI